MFSCVNQCRAYDALSYDYACMFAHFGVGVCRFCESGEEDRFDLATLKNNQHLRNYIFSLLTLSRIKRS